MVAKPRGPELLSMAFSVRLPPALLAAVDAFVAAENSADPFAASPIGRTDVFRRALVEYLTRRGVQTAQERVEAPKVKPSKAKTRKGPPRGAGAQQEPDPVAFDSVKGKP